MIKRLSSSLLMVLLYAFIDIQSIYANQHKAKHEIELVESLKEGLLLAFSFEEKTTVEVDREDYIKDISNQKSYPFSYANRVPGFAGDAFEFQGQSSSKINLGKQIEGFPLGDFTLSCWILPRKEGCLIGSGQKEWWGRRWEVKTNEFRFAPNGGNKNKFVHSGETKIYNYKVPLNEWTHFTISRQNSKITVFLNGEKTESYDEGQKKYMPIYNYGLTLGGAHYDGGNGWVGFEGLIDEFALWDRKLSENEVKNLYQVSIQEKSYCEGLFRKE